MQLDKEAQRRDSNGKYQSVTIVLKYRYSVYIVFNQLAKNIYIVLVKSEIINL